MKRLPLALAATALVIGVTALTLWRELDNSRKQLADLQTHLGKLKDLPSGAATPVVSAASAAGVVVAGSMPPVTAPASQAAPAGATPAPGTADATRAATQAALTMMNSPEGKEMMRTQLRASLARQYPDLAAEMGFSPAEAENFLDQLAKLQSESVDSAMDLALGTTSPQAMQDVLRKSMEQEVASENAVAKLLGGKYRQWEDYQGTIAARQQVNQLRAMLAGGESPLTDAQMKPLTTTLGAEHTRANRDNRTWLATQGSNSANVLEDQLRFATEHNQRLVSAAASHLSAPQLDRYKRMLAQEENMMRMMIGVMNGAGTSTPTGGLR